MANMWSTLNKIIVKQIMLQFKSLRVKKHFKVLMSLRRSINDDQTRDTIPSPDVEAIQYGDCAGVIISKVDKMHLKPSS